MENPSETFEKLARAVQTVQPQDQRAAYDELADWVVENWQDIRDGLALLAPAKDQ